MFSTNHSTNSRRAPPPASTIRCMTYLSGDRPLSQSDRAHPQTTRLFVFQLRQPLFLSPSLALGAAPAAQPSDLQLSSLVQT
mmetsp:Transcript_29769/g.63318  ORF Transcript_29769/g.63318 Transcript_29769/m.63318 type:complete len:82 (-) Transcript_29769:164-409(-)